jgi:hypothetical protein
MTTPVAERINLPNGTPTKIYLQVGPNFDVTHGVLGAFTSEVTWARENIHGNDIEYVLAGTPSPTEAALREAAEKVIEMNRQHANDQYGEADKAEAWACVQVLRAALALPKPSTKET